MMRAGCESIRWSRRVKEERRDGCKASEWASCWKLKKLLEYNGCEWC